MWTPGLSPGWTLTYHLVCQWVGPTAGVEELDKRYFGGLPGDSSRSIK
jgi:hypothetical protein